jgi:hypothetical protein
MRLISRLWPCILFLVIGLGPAWSSIALAQDATPSSGGVRPPGAETTAVGTAVTYVDAEGVEHGVVTVTEVIDPFTDFDEGYEPTDGARYVVIYVSFEATGDKSFEADPYDLLLRDTEGFLWSIASVNRGSEPEVPDAQSQTLASGNKISGAVGFVIPEAAQLAEVFYQPESGHVILLADLEDAADAPVVGTEVTYVDAENVERGVVAVLEVVDPFTDFPEGYEPEAGTRYVVVSLSFEATGEGSFDADPNDLVVRDADGFLWSTASVNRGSEPDMPDAQSQTLASGNKISGAIGFIVPADTPLTQIYYQPESGRLILLAELDAPEAD